MWPRCVESRNIVTEKNERIKQKDTPVRAVHRANTSRLYKYVFSGLRVNGVLCVCIHTPRTRLSFVHSLLYRNDYLSRAHIRYTHLNCPYIIYTRHRHQLCAVHVTYKWGTLRTDIGVFTLVCRPVAVSVLGERRGDRWLNWQLLDYNREPPKNLPNGSVKPKELWISYWG